MNPASSQNRPQSKDGATARPKSVSDHGWTADKVDWPDPAAVPLGTDDEAAGSAPSGEAVHRARAAERARPSHRPQQGGPIGAAWIMIAVVVIAVVGALAWLVTLRS